MNHLVVYAHPNNESFNHAILETTVAALKKKGHDVVVRDLYALGFEPVLTHQDLATFHAGQTPEDIAAEQKYVTEADVITFIYPIWWTGLPAILKGYIDRVFSYGYAYAYSETGIAKLLSGKKGLIINTHGTQKEIYDQIGMTDALKKTSDKGIFEFVGIEPVDHLLFGGVPSVGEDGLKEVLTKVDETVSKLF
ncbi:NAD(P)H-dependent oxidoreductase [Gorillibacterium sp. CAU 1737]|uniref:NAD(P)H-dependent oxidoreductase n=1 Tax=Gorillibacterium sp. CAU 1737 TaxID=3140362 RepID=UPI0032603325